MAEATICVGRSSMILRCCSVLLWTQQHLPQQQLGKQTESEEDLWLTDQISHILFTSCMVPHHAEFKKNTKEVISKQDCCTDWFLKIERHLQVQVIPPHRQGPRLFNNARYLNSMAQVGRCLGHTIDFFDIAILSLVHKHGATPIVSA